MMTSRYRTPEEDAWCAAVCDRMRAMLASRNSVTSGVPAHYRMLRKVMGNNAVRQLRGGKTVQFNMVTLYRFAKMLGVTVEELLANKPDEERPAGRNS